jgi:hypothetical protein
MDFSYDFFLKIESCPKKTTFYRFYKFAQSAKLRPVEIPAAIAWVDNQIEAPSVRGAATVNSAAIPIAPATRPAQPAMLPPSMFSIFSNESSFIKFKQLNFSSGRLEAVAENLFSAGSLQRIGQE